MSAFTVRGRAARFALLAISALLCVPAAAQSRYPSKPIRIIVPFAPAGGTDILARSLGARLAESMGQNVIVENRPGAASIIGTDAVAKSAPDGHTVLFTTQVLAINPSLHASMPYNAERDFAPVTIAAAAPNLLAIHPSIPVTSVRQLIAIARAKPGAITIAAAGVGTPSHLAAELFRQMAKVDLLVVQYKGGGNSLADVAGGQVATTFGTLPSLTPLVESGKLRGLAVSGAKRSKVLPNVPTVAETLAGFQSETWYAVLVPAKTPHEIVTRLHSEIVKALAHPDLSKNLAAQGFEAGGMPPAEMARVIKSETQRWAKVIRDGNIRAE
ncbi:MAG TPA: tripartite tricarboxylate transporter substrate binding protein [Burkholderiales bacterium]|nr:tripartite tricarboxylate transporter substrate binding protein [Burkholderiales bacterium]